MGNGDRNVPIEMDLKIHQLCEEFEDDWAGSRELRIEDLLARVPQPYREPLLEELLGVELEYVADASQADYLRLFPAHPAAVAAAFAASQRRAADQQDAERTVSIAKLEPKLSTNRYQTKSFHAAGGMGQVWKGEDNELGRVVAIKTLKRPLQDQAERFLAEAQIASQLDHPGIVTVHDVGKDSAGDVYYVMRFVNGLTLSKAISDAHKDVPEAASRKRRLLENFVDICDAVAYAHSRGVLHRDLKPSNVMLGEFGETLVLDWGVAKVVNHPDVQGEAFVSLTGSGMSVATEANTVIGTPSYMPPELASGQGADSGPSTDVYLLGATLYHILTGEPPRRGRSRDELLDLARDAEPLAPRKLCGSVSPRLEAICRKAMQREPEDRYASASKLAEEMRNYLADEPIQALSFSRYERLVRWLRRNQFVVQWSTAAVVLVAVLTSLALTLNAYRRSQRELRIRDLGVQLERRLDELIYEVAIKPAAAVASPASRFEFYNQSAESDATQRLSSVVREVEQSLDAGPGVESLDEQLRVARQLLDRLEPGRIAPATEDVSDSVRLQGLNAFLAGETLRRQSASDPNKLHAAIDFYKKAIALRPDDYWSHFQLGRCYASLGESKLAGERQSTCIALRPNAPWAYASRAVARFVTKDIPGAERDFALASQLAEGQSRRRCLIMLASFWLAQPKRKGYRDKVVAALDEADSLGVLPESALVCARLLMMSSQTQRGIRAQAALDAAGELPPKLPHLQRTQAWIDLVNGRNVLDNVDRSLRFDVETPQRSIRQRVLRAQTLMVWKEDDRRFLPLAVKELRAAIKQDPTDDPDSHRRAYEALAGPLIRQLYRFNADENSAKRVVEELAVGLRLYPDSLTLREVSGNIKHDFLADFSGAAEDFAQGVALEPTRASEEYTRAGCLAFLAILAGHEKDFLAVEENVKQSLSSMTLAWSQDPSLTRAVNAHTVHFLCGCAYGRLAKALGDQLAATQAEKNALDHLQTAGRIAARTNRVASLRNNIRDQVEGDTDPTLCFSSDFGASEPFQTMLKSLGAATVP